MNKIWIMSVALLLISNFSKCQSAETTNNTNRDQINKPITKPPFNLTKGYYSIYRNAEKLNHQPITVVVNKNSVDNYPKGFYSISNKHAQLHKGGKSFIVTIPSRPLATKGYYSIKQPATGNSEENLIADGVDTANVAREAN